MVCRTVSYLQDRITEAATLDLQKELLSYHGNFDSYEVFREIDVDNNGCLTETEFANYFNQPEDQDLAGTRFDLLIKHWANGGDKLSYNDFNSGLSPWGQMNKN